MTALPPSADFTDSGRNEGQIKAFVTDLRAFLAGLLGSDGTVLTALATLGALFGAGRVAHAAHATLTSADRGRLIEGSGTITLTLPSVAAAGAGWAAVVTNAGSGTVTLDGASSETVDGALTAALGAGRACVLFCTGTAWITLGLAGTAGGPLLLPAGSAAAPALSFSADPDTGLSNPSANQIGLSAGGIIRALLTTTGLQVTGTITGTAVTQSTTDATANRLLRVADFGLGGRAPAMPTADFAALPQSGLYRGTANQTTNVPASEAAVSRFFNMLAVRGSNANEMRNFLFMYPYTDGKLADLFIGGTDSAGTSVAWQRVFTQGSVLGAVSQSGGVPTGRLIEHGWNANGFFTRFASGLQVCRRTITASSAAAATWTYPAAYADAPEVTGCVVSTVLSAVCLDSTPGTTSCTFSARDKTDARRADTCQLIAVGRWFI